AVQLMRMQPTEQQMSWAQELIRRQLGDLTRLVDDLLDVSRITRGKITLAREPLDVRTLIERAVENVEPLIQARGHRFTVELPQTPLRLDGDPTRLTQALADLLPRIFELFTQLDRRVGSSSGGLGIGLALVRRLVEMHGGSVSAHSDGAGRGSEFVMKLPLLGADAAAARAEAAGTNSAPQPVSRRILVADDNADALESLAVLLKMSGHQVFSAPNGAAALEAAAEHLPEVVLLDIGMPLLDGYEVARRIRTQPWGSSMMLVALTGWGQDADRRRSQEAGFNSHLVKPLDLARLTQVLEELSAGAAPPASMSGGRRA